MKKLLIALSFIAAFSASAFGQVSICPAALSQDILKGSTAYKGIFALSDTGTNGAKTGATVTVTLSKNGGSFATPSGGGTATEIGNGWYYATLNATDTNTDGPLIIHGTASGAFWSECHVGTVVEFDPRAATTIQNIVDGVLNELCSAHTTAGTVCKLISNTATSTSQLTYTTANQLDTQVVAIAANAITATSIATDAITAAKIAADAIGASEIAADAIGASELAADAIGASEIAANAIGASEVADGAIDAGALASDAITAAKIATDAFTSDELAASALAEIRTNAGLIKVSTARMIFMKFVNSTTGAAMTSGTPACTRAIDSTTFSSTTNAASPVSALGFSTLTLSTTDTAATSGVIVRCTLASANDYNNIFYIQP